MRKNLWPAHSRSSFANAARRAISELLESRVLLAIAPVGPESIVGDDGSRVDVAMNDGGDYVVAWQMFDDRNQVHVRRFNAAGVPQGDGFHVPLPAGQHAVSPSVAMDDAGNFVVAAAWDEVYANRFDAAGNPLGQPFRVNTHTASQQGAPKSAMSADGGFVIVWTSRYQDGHDQYGVYGQRFNAAGEAQGGEFRIGETIRGNNSAPDVAIDAGGAFTVVWSRYENGVGTVMSRRFGADGMPLTGDVPINAPGTSAGGAEIDISASGEAVVTWVTVPDGSTVGQIFARQIHPAGSLGEIIPVSPTTDAQRFASIAVDADGRFLIAWQERRLLPETGMYGEQLWDEDIHARQFDANGLAQGPSFRVNTYVPGDQWEPAVAVDADGDAVIAYHSYRQGDARGGVYAQRYTALHGSAPDGVLTGTIWFDADRDGVRDDGEAVADGVAVNLFNEAGAIAGTTVTAADGSYRFDRLSADIRYFAQVVPPVGTVLTGADRGGDDTVDSDVIAASADTPVFTIPPGGTLDFDAGLVPESTVSGVVFHDRDRDGTRDAAAAEEPLAGWTVFLDDDGDARRGPNERSVVTGDDGRYRFAGLRPGTTRIALVPQRHWTIAPSGGVQLVSLGPEQNLDAHFANHSVIPSTQVLPQGPPVDVASEPLLGSPMAVAIDSAGRQIVVWQHFNGQDDDIMIQRYDADGQPLGAPYPAHTFMPAHQSYPSVAALPNGGFVVVFSGYTYIDEDAGSHDPEVEGVWLQRFDVNGAPVGAVERVDQLTDWGDAIPTIAVHPETGRLAVAWSSLGTLPTGPTGNEPAFAMLRWYNPDGTPDGAPIPFSSGVSEYQGDVDMGFAGDGTLTVVAEGDAVFFRRFAPDRQPLGPEQPLAVLGYEASAAVAPSGDFLVATQSERNGQSIMQIFARRFAPDGTPVGEEFAITPLDPSRNDYSPAVAAHADGYTVAWRRQTPAESTVYVQRYSLGGVKLGDEFPVHDASLDAHHAPVIATDGAGGFAVGFPAIRIPAFTYGIAARRYVVADNQAPTAAADVPDVAVPLSAGAPSVNLSDLFDDDQGDGALHFTLVGNTNPGLLAAAQFTPDGSLLLTPTPDLPGSSTLTVRATDAGGRSAEVTFTVIVKPEIVLSGDATYALDSYVPLDLIRLSDNARLTIPQHLMVSFKTKALTMSDNAVLDIPSYGLIIEATPETRDAVLDAVHGLLGNARNGAAGRWQGPGITSSYLLGGDALPHTTLVAIVNPGHLTDANGEPLGPDSVVITYAYDGDANLDGRVNADDYFRIDQGFLAQPANPSYRQGDFNYDGRVNADDYFLIDSAFLATTASQPAARSERAGRAVSATRAAEEDSNRPRRKPVRERPAGDVLA